LQNVAFCNVSAEELVLDWIIDDGGESRGRPHRNAIFDPNVRCVGIATGPHTVGRVACALFTEGYTPQGAAQAQAAPSHSSAPVAAPIEKLPDFVVGGLEQVDGNTANVLPITNLGCKLQDLSVGLRQNGNQVEFRRNATREGRIFNLPYQVTQTTCTASYNPRDNGGTLRIRLGKPQSRPTAVGSSSEIEVCQYTIKGDPGSGLQRVQIQVKQDNPDFYEFLPGPPTPWDTTFTVVLADTNLMFKGTFQQPEGQNTKVINSTQTVGLPVPPPSDQIETIGGGGKAVRVWHKPRPGHSSSAQQHQPDCDISITGQ